MKQKYTLTIADMELNVVTEEPHESVEYIVGIIDRKMREIALKSKKCTKNEAALLCALDLCADKIALKKKLEEIEENLEERNEKFEHLCEKLELVQKNSERLERERTRLENENARLRGILDDIRAGKTTAEAAKPVEYHAEEPEAVADVISDSVAEAVPEVEVRSSAKKKNSGKSRVGSMFDLLTFSDI